MSYHGKHLLPWKVVERNLRSYDNYHLITVGRKIHNYNAKGGERLGGVKTINNSEIVSFVKNPKRYSSSVYTFSNLKSSFAKEVSKDISGMDTTVGDVISMIPLVSELYGITLFVMSKTAHSYGFRLRKNDQFQRTVSLYHLNDAHKVMRVIYFSIKDPFRPNSNFCIGHVETELEIIFDNI